MGLQAPGLTARKGSRWGVGYNCPGFSASGVAHRSDAVRMPPSATSPPIRHFMLEAQKLAARRGFSQLFAGLSFRVGAGRGAGRDGRERHRQDHAAAHARRAVGARVRRNPLARRSASGRSIPRCARRSRSPGTCRRSRTSSPPRRISRRSSRSKASRCRARPSSDALDDVALSRQRALPARVLSQGQRRRIGLARLSLVARPLWILDEPLTALDAAGAAAPRAHADGGHLAKRRPRRRGDARAARPAGESRVRCARAGLTRDGRRHRLRAPQRADAAVWPASAGRSRAT